MYLDQVIGTAGETALLRQCVSHVKKEWAEIMERKRKSMTFIVSYSYVIKTDVLIVLNNELC